MKDFIIDILANLITFTNILLIFNIPPLGSFPLSDLNLMSDEERAKFLPAVEAFTSLLKKNNLSPAETKNLLAEAKKLDTQNFIPFNVRN